MENATITSLNLISPTKSTPLTPASIVGGIISLDMDTALNQETGRYHIELKYTIEDPEFTGVRECARRTLRIHNCI